MDFFLLYVYSKYCLDTIRHRTVSDTAMAASGKENNVKRGILFLCVLLLLVLAGCSGGEVGEPSSSSHTESSSQPVTSGESSQSGTLLSSPSEASGKQVDLQAVREKMKEIYGTSYPEESMTREEVEAMTKVPTELIDEVVADKSKADDKADAFIAIKAKEGKGEDLLGAMEVYLRSVQSMTSQYPNDLPKLNAAQLVHEGDYVFFVMLGTEKLDEQTSLPSNEHATEQIQKGVDAIREFFH